ncbi:MAG: hypothetical protein QGG48_13600, partial [Desulfatiglandales bacterium]|nr:hypothetical protein [Desulfatiglandales bacterium]
LSVSSFQNLTDSLTDGIPEGFPAGGWRSSRNSGNAVKGFRIGIPEQQLKPHANVPEARWRIYSLSLSLSIYIY